MLRMFYRGFGRVNRCLETGDPLVWRELIPYCKVTARGEITDLDGDYTRLSPPARMGHFFSAISVTARFPCNHRGRHRIDVAYGP